jgi:hypothetical protein
MLAAVKNLVLLLFASLAWAASAQSGPVISFTNAAGEVIASARVVKVFPNKIIYLTASGAGTIRLDELPPALQKKFGFNPTNAAAADAREEVDEQARDQAVYDHQLLASRQYAVEILRNRVFQTCRIIWGRVVQKLPGGLLVDSGEDPLPGVVTGEPEFEPNGDMGTTGRTEADEVNEPGAKCTGLVFLTDDPQSATAVVGDYVQVLAYRNGNYVYRPASGGPKSVRKFTADFDKAVAALP